MQCQSILKGLFRFLLIIASLFTVHTAESQFTPAQIDSLKKELAVAKEDTAKVDILRNLGNEIGYTDPAGALRYAMEGFELSKKLRFARGEGNLAYLTAILHEDLGNSMLADSFLTIAASRFTELNLPGQQAKVEHARGVQAYKKGNYWLAADFFTKTVKIFEEIRDSSSALIAYQSLTALLGQVKNHEKAIELSKKAIKLAEARKDTLSVHYSLQVLVTNLVYAERMDEASTHLNSLKKIAESTSDLSLGADIFSTLATYYYRDKQYAEAVRYSEKAVETAQQMGNQYQVANHLNTLGQSQMELGNLPDSRKSLQESLELARAFENKRAEYSVSLSLSRYFSITGDYREAYLHLQRHVELGDSILKNETRNYTTYLEASFEASKKENEILRLRQLQQEKDYQLKRRNTLLFIGAGLISMLILVLYLLRRNHRNKQNMAAQRSALLEERVKNFEKEQQVLSLQSMINGQETERTRIAKDLHDGLGGIFSTVKMHYSTLQQDTPALKDNPLYRKTFDLISNAADELRRVAHNMMPEVLMKLGLVEALQDFCNNINSGKLLKITLQTYGMEGRLGHSTEIMLYRIIQELINNIIKHARATEALVQINREKNRLSVVIEDNGRGFDTREAEEKRSMGMETVKSRVDYLNGRLTIDSRKDSGTTVMIDLLIND